MPYHGVVIQQEDLRRFCRRHHIRRLSLFGSILRDDFGPDSDVAVLAEFERGHVLGLFGIAYLESPLGSVLGRPMDLRTPLDPSTHFRNSVVGEAGLQYAA